MAQPEPPALDALVDQADQRAPFAAEEPPSEAMAEAPRTDGPLEVEEPPKPVVAEAPRTDGPLEAAGHPSLRAADRIEPGALRWFRGRRARTMEAIGEPWGDASNRIHWDDADVTVFSIVFSTMEELGEPHTSADAGGPEPSPGDEERPLWATQTMEDAARTSDWSRARVPLPPDANPNDWPERRLEGAGDPTELAAARLRAGPGEDAAGGSSAKGAGEPGSAAAARVRRPVEAAELEGASALEGAGEPATAAAARLRGPEGSAAEDATASALEGLVEAAGGRRYAPAEATANDARAASSPTAEGAGHPVLAGRLRYQPVQPRTQPEGASGLEDLGEPVPLAAARVTPAVDDDEAPSVGTLEGALFTAQMWQGAVPAPPARHPNDWTARHLEGAGEPQVEAEARLPLGAGPSASGGATLEAAASPSAHADERFVFTGGGPTTSAPTLEGAARTSTDATGRMGGPPPRPPVPTGLEGALSVPVLGRAERGPRPPPPPPEAPVGEGYTVAPLDTLVISSAPGEGQVCGQCGGPLRVQRIERERRFDFAWQSFQREELHRQWLDCPACPVEPPQRALSPAVASRRLPLSNGLLAQVLVARFGEHSPLVQVQRTLSELGLELSLRQLAEECARVGRLAAPLVSHMAAAGPAVQVDAEGVRAVEIIGRSQRRGALYGRRTPEGVLFTWVPDGEAPPAAQGSRGAASLAGTLYAAVLGRSAAGFASRARQRFFEALPRSPGGAGTALHHLHAVEGVARVDDAARARAEARLLSWLEAERQRFGPTPDTRFQRAVATTLDQWPRMAPLVEPRDSAALGPLLKGGPREWLFDAAEGGVVNAALWHSLIESCRLLGIRPWAYLTDLLSALAASPDLPVAPWTPSAWSAR